MGRRSRALGKHGVSPHTPLLGMEKCEKAALPGTHILCEHAITGKRIAGDASSAGGFCRPGIRVRKVKGLG